MAGKLNPFYNLPKAGTQIEITSELKETFDAVSRALNKACELALKQAIARKQLVVMTEATFQSAVFALMVEDNADPRTQSKQ